MKHENRRPAITKKNILKQGAQLLFFFLLMLLAFYTIFHNNDIRDILAAIKSLRPLYLLPASLCAIFYVCAEGFMIWYLLRLTQKSAKLFRCFVYSFIGFFFSGITPSATGGQPAQLIAMKKDNLPLGDSTLTLMTVALLYKLVLVFIGIGLLCFWQEGLFTHLGNYTALYFLGLFLNLLLVCLLLLVMFHGEWMEKLLLSAEKISVRFHLCKPSATRTAAFHQIITDYQNTLCFFLTHKSKIFFVTFCTFLQRCSLFLLTCFIYRGLGLTASNPLAIMGLQASIYIAVDMLPLPGSQGISELMYHTVFSPVFTNSSLPASMCITRGISFYFPLILGAIITFANFHSQNNFRTAFQFHSK